jgi:hypothetical protein
VNRRFENYLRRSQFLKDETTNHNDYCTTALPTPGRGSDVTVAYLDGASQQPPQLVLLLPGLECATNTASAVFICVGL